MIRNRVAVEEERERMKEKKMRKVAQLLSCDHAHPYHPTQQLHVEMMRKNDDVFDDQVFHHRHLPPLVLLFWFALTSVSPCDDDDVCVVWMMENLLLPNFLLLRLLLSFPLLHHSLHSFSFSYICFCLVHDDHHLRRRALLHCWKRSAFFFVVVV